MFLDVLQGLGTFGEVWGRFSKLGDVLRHLEMFGDVLGCLEHKPIHCITIYKQVSTCSKDDAILHHA